MFMFASQGLLEAFAISRRVDAVGKQSSRIQLAPFQKMAAVEFPITNPHPPAETDRIFVVSEPRGARLPMLCTMNRRAIAGIGAKLSYRKRLFASRAAPERWEFVTSISIRDWFRVISNDPLDEGSICPLIARFRFSFSPRVLQVYEKLHCSAPFSHLRTERVGRTDSMRRRIRLSVRSSAEFRRLCDRVPSPSRSYAILLRMKMTRRFVRVASVFRFFLHPLA